MGEFCREHGIADQISGKLIVATTEGEILRLEALLERGQRNGSPARGCARRSRCAARHRLRRECDA
jgi:L-2-hydroxyglutarate oxidase LhgO